VQLHAPLEGAHTLYVDWLPACTNNWLPAAAEAAGHPNEEILMRTPLVFLICLVALAGCRGTARNWEPVIDTRNVDMSRYQADLGECRQFSTSTSVAEGAGRGAAGGAVLGGAIGAIIGDSSDSAVKGAGVGTVAGGARGARAALREQQMIIRNCLRGRGYQVLN